MYVLYMWCRYTYLSKYSSEPVSESPRLLEYQYLGCYLPITWIFGIKMHIRCNTEHMENDKD